jgi:hypothetical protein
MAHAQAEDVSDLQIRRIIEPIINHLICRAPCIIVAPPPKLIKSIYSAHMPNLRVSGLLALLSFRIHAQNVCLL